MAETRARLDLTRVPKGGSAAESVHGQAVAGVDNVAVHIELRVHIDDLHIGGNVDPETVREYVESFTNTVADKIVVQAQRSLRNESEAVTC